MVNSVSPFAGFLPLRSTHVVFAVIAAVVVVCVSGGAVAVAVVVVVVVVVNEIVWSGFLCYSNGSCFIG